MKDILELLKKNLVSLICGIVAISAVVALFVPIGGYYRDLQAQADGRVADFNALHNLLIKQRHLPQLGLEETEPKPLDKFPTQPVIDLGTKLVDQLKSESDAVFKAAVAMNQHTLLVDNVLPDGGQGAAIAFRELYRQTVYMAGQTGENRKASYLVKIMHGGFRPNDLEIKARQDELDKEIRAGLVANPAGGPAFNADAIDDQIKTRLPRVPDEMRRQVAETSQVYLEYNTFDQYAALMTGSTTPEAWQMFAAQMELWIQEDVCKSIAAANKGSNSVMESAVKDLLRIQMPQGIFQALYPGQISTVPPVDDTPSQPLTKTFKDTPTGRTTNGIYDVVRFTMLMYVDGEKIPLILQELSRGKFLTVYQCNITVLDAAQKQIPGYYFGETKPLVELNLGCEALILRKWTTPYMPPGTKGALGIPLTPAK